MNDWGFLCSDGHIFIANNASNLSNCKKLARNQFHNPGSSLDVIHDGVSSVFGRANCSKS